MTRVIAPKQNEADAEDFPEHLSDTLEFTWVSRIGEVLAAALEPATAVR
jgi:ATP-dependent Lon protease